MPTIAAFMTPPDRPGAAHAMSDGACAPRVVVAAALEIVHLVEMRSS